MAVLAASVSSRHIRVCDLIRLVGQSPLLLRNIWREHHYCRSETTRGASTRDRFVQSSHAVSGLWIRARTSFNKAWAARLDFDGVPHLSVALHALQTPI